MPYINMEVPAELFLEHNNIKIYKTYKNDDINELASDYIFVLNEFDNYAKGFDVRFIKGWKEPKHPPFLIGKNDTTKNKLLWDKWHREKKLEKYVKNFIISLIDNGKKYAME